MEDKKEIGNIASITVRKLVELGLFDMKKKDIPYRNAIIHCLMESNEDAEKFFFGNNNFQYEIKRNSQRHIFSVKATIK